MLAQTNTYTRGSLNRRQTNTTKRDLTLRCGILYVHPDSTAWHVSSGCSTPRPPRRSVKLPYIILPPPQRTVSQKGEHSWPTIFSVLHYTTLGADGTRSGDSWMIGKQLLNVRLWDWAGSVEYASLRSTYIHSTALSRDPFLFLSIILRILHN